MTTSAFADTNPTDEQKTSACWSSLTPLKLYALDANRVTHYGIPMRTKAAQPWFIKPAVAAAVCSRDCQPMPAAKMAHS
jgi:hypothetical protein